MAVLCILLVSVEIDSPIWFLGKLLSLCSQLLGVCVPARPLAARSPLQQLSLVIEKPLWSPQIFSPYILNILRSTEKLHCSPRSLQQCENLMRLSLIPYTAIPIGMGTSSRLLFSWTQTKSRAKVLGILRYANLSGDVTMVSPSGLGNRDPCILATSLSCHISNFFASCLRECCLDGDETVYSSKCFLSCP